MPYRDPGYKDKSGCTHPQACDFVRAQWSSLPGIVQGLRAWGGMDFKAWGLGRVYTSSGACRQWYNKLLVQEDNFTYQNRYVLQNCMGCQAIIWFPLEGSLRPLRIRSFNKSPVHSASSTQGPLNQFGLLGLLGCTTWAS